MLVCPKCGSDQVEELGFSGYSGFSGHSGLSGYSAIGASGVSGVAMGHTHQKLVPQAPKYVPPKPMYLKSFQCRTCRWIGKENELIDDFKLAIRNALAVSGIKLSTATKECIDEVVEELNGPVNNVPPPPCNKVVKSVDAKKVIKDIGDVLLGKKRTVLNDVVDVLLDRKKTEKETT